ncbi:MAG: hypothetical protein ACI95C_001747 [Pseudohongiellaceae bacterium]
MISKIKISSAKLIEAADVFGVIASLIFVGMQLRLDRQLAIAGQFQSRTGLRIQQETTFLDNSDFIQDRASAWEKKRPDWWNIEIESIFAESYESMSEMTRDHRTMIIFAVLMENNYYQYRQGFFGVGTWLKMRAALQNTLRNPIRRSVYKGFGNPDFSRLLDTLTEELDIENNQL